jgi:hypothetical protein
MEPQLSWKYSGGAHSCSKLEWCQWCASTEICCQHLTLDSSCLEPDPGPHDSLRELISIYGQLEDEIRVTKGACMLSCLCMDGYT